MLWGRDHLSGELQTFIHLPQVASHVYTLPRDTHPLSLSNFQFECSCCLHYDRTMIDEDMIAGIGTEVQDTKNAKSVNHPGLWPRTAEKAFCVSPPKPVPANQKSQWNPRRRGVREPGVVSIWSSTGQDLGTLACSHGGGAAVIAALVNDLAERSSGLEATPRMASCSRCWLSRYFLALNLPLFDCRSLPVPTLTDISFRSGPLVFGESNDRHCGCNRDWKPTLACMLLRAFSKVSRNGTQPSFSMFSPKERPRDDGEPLLVGCNRYGACQYGALVFLALHPAAFGSAFDCG